MTPKFLLTIPETAAALGVSRSFFYEMRRSGRCPLESVKFNSRRLYRAKDVEAWVDAGSKPDWRPQTAVPLPIVKRGKKSKPTMAKLN